MAGRDAGVYPSDWYTTVWIHNPGSEVATARIFFLERGTANLDPPWVDMAIAAGETERIDNIVETLFHRETFGALRITCAAQRLAVTSRTYSKGPAQGERDSVGQDFAAVPPSFAIGLGEKAQILGAQQTLPAAASDSRFNFGFVETTGHSATVRVTAFDATGASQGYTDLQVREHSQRQVAFKDRFPGVSTTNSRLEAEVISGAGKVIAYGSGIANGSQDSTTFEAVYADTLLAEHAPTGVTEVAAGQGLTGGGAGPTVTLDVGAGAGIVVNADTVSIADAGIGNAKIADGAVTPAKLSPAGSAAGQGLISNGDAVVWGAVAGPPGPQGPQGPPGPATGPGKPGFSLSTADPAFNVGLDAAVTIGVDGLPLIAYWNSNQASLKVVHCSNLTCSSATRSTLEVVGTSGGGIAITIGADGRGLISYYHGANRDLKVAHCTDTICSEATTTTLDSAGDLGWSSSIVIGADGLGLVSYLDVTNETLKVAHCSDVACSSATTTALASARGPCGGTSIPPGGACGGTSITIGGDGLGLIAFSDSDTAKMAHCADTSCSTAGVATVFPAPWGHPSITTGSDGFGLIASGGIVAHCSDLACTTATSASITPYATDASISIGVDGLGVISSYRFIDANTIVAAVSHCSDVACSTGTSASLEVVGDLGVGTSIAVGVDGFPVVAYRRSTITADLRVAHCSNVFCIPYFRRR
jgi:hypothetical protein